MGDCLPRKDENDPIFKAAQAMNAVEYNRPPLQERHRAAGNPLRHVYEDDSRPKHAHPEGISYAII